MFTYTALHCNIRTINNTVTITYKQQHCGKQSMPPLHLTQIPIQIFPVPPQQSCLKAQQKQFFKINLNCGLALNSLILLCTSQNVKKKKLEWDPDTTQHCTFVQPACH